MQWIVIRRGRGGWRGHQLSPRVQFTVVVHWIQPLPKNWTAPNIKPFLSTELESELVRCQRVGRAKKRIMILLRKVIQVGLISGNYRLSPCFCLEPVSDKSRELRRKARERPFRNLIPFIFIGSAIKFIVQFLPVLLELQEGGRRWKTMAELHL